jgi:hypothetical protein
MGFCASAEACSGRFPRGVGAREGVPRRSACDLAGAVRAGAPCTEPRPGGSRKSPCAVEVPSMCPRTRGSPWSVEADADELINDELVGAPSADIAGIDVAEGETLLDSGEDEGNVIDSFTLDSTTPQRPYSTSRFDAAAPSMSMAAPGPTGAVARRARRAAISLARVVEPASAVAAVAVLSLSLSCCTLGQSL